VGQEAGGTCRRRGGVALEAHDVTRAMASVRFLSAAIEASAAFVMLRSSLERAVGLNAVLGLVGPTIFVVVSALGVIGLAGRISALRLVLVCAGVLLVLASSRAG
jgi:hypothetical protein